MVAQSPMAAPKNMSSSASTTPSKPASGLRKLFGRKNSHKKDKDSSHGSAAQLKVASPPPNVRSFPSKQSQSQQSQQQRRLSFSSTNNNTGKEQKQRRGFFSRNKNSKEPREFVRTPSVQLDPAVSSGESSSEEGINRVLPQVIQPSKRGKEEKAQQQQQQQTAAQNGVQEHIRSIRPIHDNYNNTSHRASPLLDTPAQRQSSLEALQPVREAGRRSTSTSVGGLTPNNNTAGSPPHCKTRDGFCRRVDTYDGSVITVESQAAYELGNYLGGGVAGVVYEGHRLLPVTEYPVRTGAMELPKPAVIDVTTRNNGSSNGGGNSFDKRVNSLLSCVPGCLADNQQQLQLSEPPEPESPSSPSLNHTSMIRDDGSFLTMDSYRQDERSLAEELPPDTVAVEAVDRMVLIDAQDAPSRSKHMARAVVSEHSKHQVDFPSDASFTGAGFMEETVAIKILNPVGFRTLASDVTQQAVVARPGEQLSHAALPMEEKHVWWLVNPQSRNLRTLQRYTIDTATPRGVEVDRGSPERGLRISLVAAYKDPADDYKLKELPLTRCIEIWGHVPFEASDQEFRDVMTAIDKINQGLPPPPIAAFDASNSANAVPGRVPTMTSSLAENGSLAMAADGERQQPWHPKSAAVPMAAKRTGIYRAASTARKTVFCSELQAYIALPAVPSKYLKWLRQRRAATKEIRNMMLIGRHRNVVHLFEVLELIQDTKSTMFLILELVRGGELFDLISSNTAKISARDSVPSGYTESETVMRKFFLELASGIQYCHLNNIAHRDLKPENLLVHNGDDGNCTLKIADFGLSAVFGPNGENVNDNDTIAVESYVSGPPVLKQQQAGKANDSSMIEPPLSPIKQHVTKLLSAGNTALGFFTCGAVEDILNCSPRMSDVDPSPLKRMTSVVGSPHYVAPEIISQQDKRNRKKGEMVESAPGANVGYDGTKADVWSAGVILYAMLFRSLPFGEDLLRCPRYQSYKKWYDEVVRGPRNRRSDLMSPLNPVITDVEDRDFLGPHWFFPSDSSPESRDLIVYMLNPNPDQRPSIQLVLQHPWLLKKA